MLELTNIELWAGNHLLVDQPLNLTEKSGQAIVFFGRNGTGKTTLLRTIAGRSENTKGEISISTNRLGDIPFSQWAKLITYVSSMHHFNQEANVKEYLASARLGYASGLGLFSRNDEIIIQKWIDRIGLQSLLPKNYAQLSDGEKQLVSIARAFIYETPVLLLDEPTSALDMPNKKRITDLLHQQAKTENKLIVYTSHDYFTVKSHCEKIWFLTANKQFYTGDFSAMDGLIRKDFELNY